jgi:hypothetical protein
MKGIVAISSLGMLIATSAAAQVSPARSGLWPSSGS